jgi:hypothetical protein
MLLDNLLQLPFIGKFFGIFFEYDMDFGATVAFIGRLYSE